MTIVITPSSGPVSASQVPARYDVIIDGKGYVFARGWSDSQTFNRQRAIFSFSPTFVERTNTSGAFGDNEQDFFLTSTQHDWSEGEQQKFFVATDADSVRRFWAGTNIDISVQGQVTLRKAIKSLTYAAAVRALCPRGQGSSQDIMAASSSNLYQVNPAGAITDQGAHGLGAAPSRFGAATDGANVYLSTSGSGSVGVRKWTGSAFSTWSSTPSDALCYLNNALYGVRSDTAELNVYSTAGAATQKAQWKDASGNARGGTVGRIRAFGGDLLILWNDGDHGAELWQFDGTGVSILAQLPPNFYAHDMDIAYGTVYISGSTTRISNGSSSDVICRPAIYSYVNGTMALVWEATSELPATSALTTAGHPAVAAYGKGVVFTDDTRGALMQYDVTTAGVHTIASYAVANDTPLLCATQRFAVHTRNSTAAYLYPDTTTTASTGTVVTSLMDFSSSLTKYFKSVLIDADVPAGASVDLSYQVNGVDGAWTSIATGVASGTEYDIGVNARSITIKVTLNKGSSTDGPTLKRIYVRGAPILTSFKLREYLIDLSGRDGKTPVMCNDDTPHPKDGFQMASDLIASLQSQDPVQITDEFGTFTGIIQPDGFLVYEDRPNEYVARVKVREV